MLVITRGFPSEDHHVMADQAEKLCGSVELGLGPDAPLLVKYDLESSDKVPLRGAQVLLVYIYMYMYNIYLYIYTNKLQQASAWWLRKTCKSPSTSFGPDLASQVAKGFSQQQRGQNVVCKWRSI